MAKPPRLRIASPRLRLSHLLVSVTPRFLSRIWLQGGAAPKAAASQIWSFFTIWGPLLLSCIDGLHLDSLAYMNRCSCVSHLIARDCFASDTATENQKNTTVTDQNTISLSVSDESKSTALTDSVDNSPQSRFE
ncbi:unnamed protein product [Brassica oleracea var. botrytis]